MGFLSKIMFDVRDHRLLTIVNDVLNRDKLKEDEKRKFYRHFHPNGIKKMAESRGLRIAYAVIHLLESIEAGKREERISALRILRDEVLNASEGAMAKNTARVLLQIMKELVRTQGNMNLQLKLAHDFRVTAAGNPRIIRRQLRHYNLLEMPEEWNQLAFDDHVHDANTKGRKSPTHLIMDAWIKGIRRLRVIYYNHIEAQFAAELLEAADIMGITLRIGIEFDVRFRNRYVQLIWVPRGFIDTQAFLCFLEEEEVLNLMEEGRKASDFRQKQILQVLDSFNQIHRNEINKKFGIFLDPIDRKAFLEFVKPGQASLLHLAKFIHTKLHTKFEQKILELRLQCNLENYDDKNKDEALVSEMNELDFETILDLFLTSAKNPNLPDPMVALDRDDVPDILKLSPRELVYRLIKIRSSCRITLSLTDLKPEDVIEIIYDCDGLITRLETFNLKNYTKGKTSSFSEISQLQTALNESNVITLKRTIQDIIEKVAESSCPDKISRIEKLTEILHDIHCLHLMYKGTPLKSRIGSDSTGQSPRMHGMGMVVIDTLPKRAVKEVMKKKAKRIFLPFRLAAYRRITYIPRNYFTTPARSIFNRISSLPGLRWLLQERRTDWVWFEHFISLKSLGNIVTLGGIHESTGNRLYLCPPDYIKEKLHLSWIHLNTLLKNLLKITIGFIPAFLAFFLRYDWWVLKFGGAFIWFGITGFRNIVQSVLGGGGLRSSPMLGWKDYVSWERICDSLLYTGFSVPLLDWIVKSIILDQAFGINTTTNPMAMYSIMAISNGIYLSSHNAFRGFPAPVIAGNFFRSVLSIPLAIALNSTIGGILSIAGVAGIDAVLQKWAAIISKASSDTVAGIIEGSADRYRNIQKRLRDYKDKLSKLLDAYTSLEMLFPDKDVLEKLNSVEKRMSGDARELEMAMIIHALDFLFFWNYQPRGRTALRMFIKTLSEEEKHILLGSLNILRKQREISLLFINGMIGKNFSTGLAFYLDNAPQYMEQVKKILGTGEINGHDKNSKRFLV